MGRRILNSKGGWALEVDLVTREGVWRASAPSGTSTGEGEATERKDALQVLEKISPKIEGKSFKNLKEFDEFLIALDGTENKKKLGGNTCLALSIAFLRAESIQKNGPVFSYLSSFFPGEALFLPRPAFLMMEGGLHAGGEVSTQEFMFSPSGGTVREKVEKGVALYHALSEILKKEVGLSSVNTGMEGGLTPALSSSKDVLDYLKRAVSSSGIKGEIILDVAAGSFYDANSKTYNFEGERLTGKKLAQLYENLIKSFDISAIEDPFSEKDVSSWEFLKDSKCKILGDDLTVTDFERIKRHKEVLEGVIVKPNQVGTVSETLKAVKTAKEEGLEVFAKHRSGETNDHFITDLSVAVRADYLMTGAPVRGERVSKYNRLLRIEENLI